MSLFLEGGFAMLFVAVFGLVALVSAARYALQPVPGAERAIVAYGAAVLFVSLAGVAIDLDAVGTNVAAHPEWADEAGGLGLVVLVGVGEALSPAIVGLAVLGVVSLLLAIGLRRSPQ